MDWLWEPLEYLGEVLVFVGVVGEVLTERKIVLKDDTEKRDSLEEIASWILIGGLAISLAALIGTNRYFNGTIASLNLQAQQAGERAAQDERDASEARKEANSFQTQIADSTARTKVAEAKVASAEAESRSAVAKVATADARIADAQRKAAEATKTAEKERIEETQLEAQVSPRRLTLAEMQAVASRCKPLRSVSVRVSSYMLDIESAILAKQIISALHAAGMNVEDRTISLLPFDSFWQGIYISGTDQNAKELVRQALWEDGKLAVAPVLAQDLPFTGMSMGRPDPVPVSILVGVKPIH